jgi:hypothetical protein
MRIQSTFVSTTAVKARDVGGHGFIGATGLHLVMGTPLGATFGFPAHKVIAGRFGMDFVHTVGCHCGELVNGFPFFRIELGDGTRFNGGWFKGWSDEYMYIAHNIAQNGTQVGIVEHHEILVRPTFCYFGIVGDPKCAVIHGNLNIRCQSVQRFCFHFGYFPLIQCTANQVPHKCRGIFAKGSWMRDNHVL